MTMALAMFLFFVGVTLVITYWAARRTSGASAFFAANRQIKGWQNGFAVAGDYMSAASFLGIAGIIAFQGYDGFMYSVGWLVAYLTVLLIVLSIGLISAIVNRPHMTMLVTIASVAAATTAIDARITNPAGAGRVAQSAPSR